MKLGASLNYIYISGQMREHLVQTMQERVKQSKSTPSLDNFKKKFKNSTSYSDFSNHCQIVDIQGQTWFNERKRKNIYSNMYVTSSLFLTYITDRDLLNSALLTEEKSNTIQAMIHCRQLVRSSSLIHDGNQIRFQNSKSHICKTLKKRLRLRLLVLNIEKR